MDEKAAFSDRLKQAMTAAGYEPRPAVLEKQFNSRYWGKSLTFQAVSRWLNGQSIPSQEKLQVLAEWLAVEPQALRYGEETVRKVKAKQDRWAKMAPEDRDLVDALLALPMAKKKIVKEVVMAFSGQAKT
jgi:transcriptional regulator with XRE-family HTH domain